MITSIAQEIKSNGVVPLPGISPVECQSMQAEIGKATNFQIDHTAEWLFSAEETCNQCFSLPSLKPITLPCDSAFIEYRLPESYVRITQREPQTRKTRNTDSDDLFGTITRVGVLTQKTSQKFIGDVLRSLPKDFRFLPQRMLMEAIASIGGTFLITQRVFVAVYDKFVVAIPPTIFTPLDARGRICGKQGVINPLSNFLTEEECICSVNHLVRPCLFAIANGELQDSRTRQTQGR